MKTKLFALLALAAGLVVLGARAQTAAPATDPMATPQASQVVYAPRLPSAAELTSVAAAQGLTIDKIVQTASQMTVVYRSADGQTNTVAYLLLPAAGTTTSTVAVATTTPPPTVVYAAPAPAAPVNYYDPSYYPSCYPYYPSYYAGPWYPPVSVSLGFGWGWGYGYHGGFNRGGRGDYHGGRGGHHGGHH